MQTFSLLYCVSGSFSALYDSRRTPTISCARRNLTTVDLTAEWVLFAGGKRIHATKIGNTMIDLARENRAQTDATQRKDECVRPDLIEYGRYDFIVRQDGMYEVFGRIGELRKRLLHFYLLRKVYKCSGRLQAGHPESIQLPTFGTGYVNAFVGYLQALVAFVQQLQRLVKAKLMLRSFLCGREALRRDGVIV